jgi:hypothetical protein
LKKKYGGNRTSPAKAIRRLECPAEKDCSGSKPLQIDVASCLKKIADHKAVKNGCVTS